MHGSSDIRLSLIEFKKYVVFRQRQTIFVADLLSSFLSTIFLNQKLHNSMKFHTTSTKDLSNIHQTCYEVKDKPIEASNSSNSYPIYCENGKDKFILQLFDNDLKVNITPLTEYNVRQ